MGFIVRSRFGQNAEEERASLFHAGRELKNNKNNLFTLKKDGIQLTDESTIEAEVIRFFGALFKETYHQSVKFCKEILLYTLYWPITLVFGKKLLVASGSISGPKIMTPGGSSFDSKGQ